MFNIMFTLVIGHFNKLLKFVKISVHFCHFCVHFCSHFSDYCSLCVHFIIHNFIYVN